MQSNVHYKRRDNGFKNIIKVDIWALGIMFDELLHT